MLYLIKKTLEETDSLENAIKGKVPFAAVCTKDEWLANHELYDMGIDMTMIYDAYTSEAIPNIDCLTGTFCIPDRNDLLDESYSFAFALDEKGIVFIDDSGYAAKNIEVIRQSRKWKNPSLERFFYDFLERIVSDDLRKLDFYQQSLDAIENRILETEDGDSLLKESNAIRARLLRLQVHYEQLIDLGNELEENENNFFRTGNLRYFRMFSERCMRLKEICVSLREHTGQIRDLYQSKLQEKQNHIMTVLTVVTTIFAPLTLITGWYGMNFRYMPELEKPFAYPIVFVIALGTAVLSLVYFKKKKWL